MLPKARQRCFSLSNVVTTMRLLGLLIVIPMATCIAAYARPLHGDVAFLQRKSLRPSLQRRSHLFEGPATRRSIGKQPLRARSEVPGSSQQHAAREQRYQADDARSAEAMRRRILSGYADRPARMRFKAAEPSRRTDADTRAPDGPQAASFEQVERRVREHCAGAEAFVGTHLRHVYRGVPRAETLHAIEIQCRSLARLLEPRQQLGTGHSIAQAAGLDREWVNAQEGGKRRNVNGKDAAARIARWMAREYGYAHGKLEQHTVPRATIE